EAPDAPQVGFELELQRAREDDEPDRSLDRVEGPESLQGTLDTLGGLALHRGPALAPGGAAEHAGERVVGPLGVLAPAPRSCRGNVETVHEGERKLAQRPGPCRVAGETSRGRLRGI